MSSERSRTDLLRKECKACGRYASVHSVPAAKPVSDTRNMSQRTIGDATLEDAESKWELPRPSQRKARTGHPRAQPPQSAPLYPYSRRTTGLLKLRSPDLQHDLAVVGALQHEAVRLAGLLHRQDVSDLGTQFALLNPRLHGLQTAADQFVVLGEYAEPESVSEIGRAHV